MCATDDAGHKAGPLAAALDACPAGYAQPLTTALNPSAAAWGSPRRPRPRAPLLRRGLPGSSERCRFGSGSPRCWHRLTSMLAAPTAKAHLGAGCCYGSGSPRCWLPLRLRLTSVLAAAMAQAHLVAAALALASASSELRAWPCAGQPRT